MSFSGFTKTFIQSLGTFGRRFHFLVERGRGRITYRSVITAGGMQWTINVRTHESDRGQGFHSTNSALRFGVGSPPTGGMCVNVSIH